MNGHVLANTKPCKTIHALIMTALWLFICKIQGSTETSGKFENDVSIGLVGKCYTGLDIVKLEEHATLREKF